MNFKFPFRNEPFGNNNIFIKLENYIFTLPVNSMNYSPLFYRLILFSTVTAQTKIILSFLPSSRFIPRVTVIRRIQLFIDEHGEECKKTATELHPGEVFISLSLHRVEMKSRDDNAHFAFRARRNFLFIPHFPGRRPVEYFRRVFIRIYHV